MPNVTAMFTSNGGGYWLFEYSGATKRDRWVNAWVISPHNGASGYFFTLDNSLVSNQYINNLKEVRVKSIISIGFIKLF